MTAREDIATPTILVDERFSQHSRWLPGERLHDVFARLVGRFGDRPAMDTGDRVHSFADIDRRAGAIAALLRGNGVAAGDRVALVLDRTVDAYAAMIAVSRVGAAFVPLDAAFPPDRIGYICQDAGVRVALTSADLHRCFPGDEHVALLDVEDATDVDAAPPTPAEGDALAYVIYTSGTTGRPKGVAVAHSAICNFVRVAAEVYGFRPGDRVYQGMTIAFDFSVEESWVPWLAGATLVPRPSGPALLGDDLQAFVLDRGITALCCVPTLLSTLDDACLDQLRLLLVSGEACPQELVGRWHRPGRRFLNVYGPTEATVTATWTEVHPQREVTLGRPLPTYQVVVLEPDSAALVAPGEVGEIGIAGIGLARGYLGREDLTAAAFVPDFLGLPNNPSGRIYRTGDLGRITAEGEVAYLGRIDTQVKIRGYRIELTEIESVLLGVPGVGQAVVDTWEPVAGITELVAYYTLRDESVTEDRLVAELAERVPAYMRPAYFHRMDVIPLTTSDKADRRNLPAPSSGRRVAGDVARVAPETAAERALADVVGGVLGCPDVSVTADFFADLGATSLLMARLCSAARAAGIALSIKDCYARPNVRALAALAALAARPTTVATAPSPATAVELRSARRRSFAFAATGVAQLALVLGYLWLLVAVGDLAARQVHDAWSAAVVGAVVLVALCLAPIALKWLLVGRWREQCFPLWGPRYLRFWLVKTLVRGNPLVLFAGTPIYNTYLRALGAHVGPRALVLTRHVPVCTDLVRIGADAVVRADVWMQGYRVDGGVLTTGPVEIGDGAFVGEGSVLDIASRLDADGQLAHASSLHRGQQVPAAARWHGSPAEPAPADTDFRRLDPAPRRTHRGLDGARSAVQILAALAVVLIVAVGEVALVTPGLGGSLDLLLWAAVGSAVLLFGSLTLSALVAVTVGRWAGRLLRPDTPYPLHGRRHAVLRLAELASNRPFLVTLLGDSSLITGWMSLVGWRLGEVEQTGSNFGTTHRHQLPTLTGVGRGTMISDGLSVVHADFSSTHFRVRPVTIGAHAFLGNKIVYPAGARVGDNVLLASKVLVPIDGPVRHDVGLLGSPAFEIPRSAADRGLATPADRLPAVLAAKRRHNLASMGLLLLARWSVLFVVFALDLVAASTFDRFGSLGAALMLLASVLVSAGWLALVERLARGPRLAPHTCSIHDRYFWRHERLWKLLTPYLAVFDGTPLKPQLLRLLGVRVGARLFDDGGSMPEHSLVELGTDCTLNAGTILQAHSLEDGTFASDHIRLGDRVTLGVAAYVHYGTRLDDDATVEADSFLMKGSHVAAGTRWLGNPAAPFT